MDNKQRQFLIIGGVIAFALVAVGIVIAFSGNRVADDIDYSALPQSRTEDGAFVLGNPDATVTLVEFADWACSHCQTFQPVIHEFIRDHVVTGRANFEFRLFRTAGGTTTVYASQLAECAEEQQPGAFWQSYPLFYNLALSSRYSPDILRSELTSTVDGLNTSDLLSCSTDAQQIFTDMALGQENEVTGTPAVRIRYNDSELQPIVWDGRTYTGGELTNAVITQIINASSPAA